jgi:SAM-dependent methyltransferase
MVAEDHRDSNTLAPVTRECPVCGSSAQDLQHALRSRDRLFDQPTVYSVDVCRTCGAGSTWPRLTAGELERHYPPTYFARWESRSGTGAVASLTARFDELRLEQMLRGPYRPVAARPPGRLLDVGCGSGDLTARFRKRGWEVFGVDTAPAAVDLARRRGIDMHCGTIEEAPWKDGFFDAVLFTDSLEHIPDPRSAVRRAASLLKPDGVLGVTVPNFGGWQRRVFGGYWFHLDLPRHLQHFDVPALTSLLRTAALEPVSVSTSSMVLGLPGSVQYRMFGRCVVRRGLRAAQVAFLLIHPLVHAIDHVGGGDRLHMIARRVDETAQGA